MFGPLGVPELIFIFALALLIFGPRKLPEIGRTIGRGLSEFRKASTDLKRSLNAEMIEEEMRQMDPRKMSPQKGANETSRDEPDGAGSEAEGDRADVSDQPPPPAAGEQPAVDVAPEGSVPRSASGETPADSEAP